MTMHLSQHTTLRSTRVRIRYTNGNLERWTSALIKVNRERKQRGECKLTISEYIDYIHGIKTDPTQSKPYTHKETFAEQRSKENKKYKSIMLNSGKCTVPDRSYTAGIAEKYTIAPAYNKGGYQVVAPSDIKYIGK